MKNDNSKYEAQMFEAPQRFLLSPCYVSAWVFERGVVLKLILLFFAGGIFL